jgi:hypothetical protein
MQFAAKPAVQPTPKAPPTLTRLCQAPWGKVRFHPTSIPGVEKLTFSGSTITIWALLVHEQVATGISVALKK